MKTFLFIVLALTIAMGAACMNDIPTDPTPDIDDAPNFADIYKDYPTNYALDIPTVDNPQEVERVIIDLKDILRRQAQAERMPPGWIPDGTLMTDEEILVHMAAHIAQDILPGGMDHPAFCSVYTYFHTCFSGVDIPPPFTYARFLVWFMESNGWDVPDVQDIFPDC